MLRKWWERLFCKHLWAFLREEKITFGMERMKTYICMRCRKEKTEIS
tara:strand:- start:237 stop:377 length:141 start_codon:yes stop_codon:yes gene_type:complete